jgi:hypothetical protein
MGSPRRNVIRFAAVGLCVALAGCNSRPTPAPVGGATSSKADKARKDAEALAVGVVLGAGDAQAKAVPSSARRGPVDVPFNVRIEVPKAAPALTAPSAPAASAAPVVKGPPGPKSPPRPGAAPAVVRERVASAIPYATEAEAEEDALAQARDLVELRLAALDPPVRYKPSVGEVKVEYVRKDSRTVRPPDAEERATFAGYFPEGVSEKLVYVEYDVEVTADQVRELRSQERVSGGMRVLGVLVAVALAGFLFLRADEWTKGYLTRWLAFAAVLLAGGVAAALIFV